MKTYEIDILIKKYLDAETTLKEESILCDYFNNNEVEEHLKIYKSLFTYFNHTKLERYGKSVAMPIKKRNYSWMNIAASFIIVLGLYIGYENNQKAQYKLAMEQTTSAFKLLSNNLNKGVESISYLEEFNKTTNKIFKQ
jgi:hypothetical protein